MDGVVTALNAEIGETVIVGTTNNPGSVIMEIADLSEMLVKAQIDESNIAPVKVGQQATVFINAYPDREFEGEVRQIGLKRQVAADGTGYFEVEILVRLEEGERLLSGLTASVDVAVEEFFDVLRVPSQCVLDRRVEDLPKGIRDASEHIDAEKAFARVVYRMESGKAVAVPVRVGSSDLTHTVIEAGLNPEDRVVSGPYRVLVDIKHDQAVRDEDVPLPGSKEAKDAAARTAAEQGDEAGEGAAEGEGAGENESQDDEGADGADAGEAQEVAAP
jgi:HlyD family secretion protein